MRRCVWLGSCVLLLALLCACSRFIPAEYTQTQPHSTDAARTEAPPALTASGFFELKNAILTLVETGTEHGTIRVTSYDGDLEADLPRAAYQVAREDPVGDYAIDYITHDATLIVSYYEIHIDITFRAMRTPLNEIEHVTGVEETRRMVQEALKNYDDHLTLYCVFNLSPDYTQIVQSYCAEHLRDHAAVPELTVTYFPATGRSRIVELTFGYPADAQTLRDMDAAVADSLRAAGVYVRYREDPAEKAELLFSYLAERFQYRERATRTPVYSALCEGLATSESMAACWQMLCEEAGLECLTVSGMRGGGGRQWNLLRLGEDWYHVDILRDLLEGGALQLCYDEDMTGEYYWDVTQVPACPRPEPEILPPPETTQPEPVEPEPEPGTPDTPDTPDAPDAPDAPDTPDTPDPGDTTEPDPAGTNI